jgi:drug/metabolite transporter (DMT)-like permease
MKKRFFVGYGSALLSAALVGLFTILNKWLLVEMIPALTAGAWIYFAAGVALLPWAIRAGGMNFSKPHITIGWILAGSVIGPSLYFIGLRLTSGTEGVLLINSEAVFTAILAFIFFKEKLTKGTLWASIIILTGAVWMSWSGNSLLSNNTFGNLLIAIGYFGWATENNLGRLLGESIPPVTLVCLKALVAGIAMGILSLIFGESLAIPWSVVPGIFASGAVSLGLSLVLFYSAMRHIGAGKTGLISSTSTLWGVIGAIFLLGESITGRIVIGGMFILIGVLIFTWGSNIDSSKNITN